MLTKKLDIYLHYFILQIFVSLYENNLTKKISYPSNNIKGRVLLFLFYKKKDLKKILKTFRYARKIPVPYSVRARLTFSENV